MARRKATYYLTLFSIVHLSCGTLLADFGLPEELRGNNLHRVAAGVDSIVNPGSTWIEGSVFDVTTQQPIEWAYVASDLALVRLTLTDEEGRFRLFVPRRTSSIESFQLVVRKDGYLESVRWYEKPKVGGIYLRALQGR